MSARATFDLLTQHMPEEQALRALYRRGSEELVHARCRLWDKAGNRVANCAVPRIFWWPSAHEGREHNWVTGDFEVWLGNADHTYCCVAYGIEFLREDIEALVGRAAPVPEPVSEIPQTAPELLPEAKPRGGRRPANWWDDLWAEIGAQIYLGDLKPECQADIEGAMLDWIEGQGFSASESTVRERARKLFKAIEKKG